jgi:hypothetical protein
VPATDVVYYADAHGKAPAHEWLLGQSRKVQAKFAFTIEQLEEKGGTLKRPYAAPLRDKIYELRVQWQQVQYRLLYFFHGNVAAVLAHGCTKESAVDDADIDRTIARRDLFLKDPSAHTYRRLRPTEGRRDDGTEQGKT